MKDSVIIRDVSCHEVHENVAPHVAMSESPVVYDKELSYAEENNDKKRKRKLIIGLHRVVASRPLL